MIVKDIERNAKPSHTVGEEGARRAMTRALVRVLQYVTDDDLGVARADDEDPEIVAAAEALVGYIMTEKPGSNERATEVRCAWSGDDSEITPREFLDRAVVLTATADPSHVRHTVISDPVATIDQVVDGLHDVYGPRASILVARHADTQHPHFHAIVITVDPATGKGFQTNKGFDREMLHMMAARADFENKTPHAPNALFVSNGEGIFDRWSGLRVADQQLKVDVGANQRVRRARQAMDNDPANHIPGWKVYRAETRGLKIEPPPWDDKRVATIMARPRITRSQSWEELHASLAMIGIRYEKYRGNGRLALGDESSIAASEAVSTASMNELERRLGTFRPLQDESILQPFVRPRFTLSAEERESADERQAARNRIKAERDKIEALAAEESRAFEAEERRVRELDLWEVSRKARSEIAKRPRRQIAESKRVTADPSEADGLIYPTQPDRIMALVSLYRPRYKRRRQGNRTDWLWDGQIALREWRDQVVVMKGAEMRDALLLAQLKWGEDFQIFGSRKFVNEMSRAAAKHGIVFGDGAQRAKIDGYRMGMSGSAKKTTEAASAFTKRIAALWQTTARQLSEQRKLFDEGVERSRRKGETREASRSRTTLPAPSERRAMIRFQEAEHHRPDEVLFDFEPRLGMSSRWLRDALAKNPEDIAAERLQGRLLADFYRQQAEREILLHWQATGCAAIDGERLVSNEMAPWVQAALTRENENVYFLRSVNSRAIDPAIKSEDPDIQAMWLAREPHSLHNSDIARLELAFRLLKKAGSRNDKGQTLWKRQLNVVERDIVETAIANAPEASPTFVVDKTLIANMTPAERALASRQGR